MKVWFVATIRKVSKYGTEGSRTVGYFKTLKEAKQCIENNWGDIYEEGYYPYAVIEGAEDGLYPTILKSLWYKWSDGKYQPVDKPMELNHIVNFTIG